MELTITEVDYSPEELHEQTPIIVKLLREITGEDRDDYWLGKVIKPIRWINENLETEITHIVVASRWQGTFIEPKVKNLPIGISYVKDLSVLDDEVLDFNKCEYVAIGISHETSDDPQIKKRKKTLSGTIGRFFGTGG
ncbi:MAG: hypothetical protein PF517_07895 [Salinivirgaceae bacterium]|jgi:hypothetical protein|nr:hypothetical protein [Salinivirgaceae bacterium]